MYVPFFPYSRGFSHCQNPAMTPKTSPFSRACEAVRRRPGMYIGSTGPRGLHHLVYEVRRQRVDEALARATAITSSSPAPDGRVSVSDNGRGIPVAAMADSGVPAARGRADQLHAGGKFGGEGYKVSGGLHGVGISVVNALSRVPAGRGAPRRRRLARRSTSAATRWGRWSAAEHRRDRHHHHFLPDAEIFDETGLRLRHARPSGCARWPS